MNSDTKEHDEHVTTHGLSSTEGAMLQRLVIAPMTGVWYRSSEFLPEDRFRVLVYSPSHVADKTMRLRMMDACFVRISTDSEWWQLPELPL